MNLRDFEYLTALAAHRHFGRAALACDVSQPTLSTQIQKLERELGVQLVERAGRSVVLTPAGEAILPIARELLAQTRKVQEVAAELSNPEVGVLRLGGFPTLLPYLLPHVIGKLRGNFPKLEFRLVEEKTAKLLELLDNGTLDVALVAQPVSEPGLTAISLFSEPFLLAVPSHSPIATNTMITHDDLAGLELLLLNEGHCLRTQTMDFCSGIGATKFGSFEATSLEALRQMVAFGVGATLLPQLAVSPPVPDNPHLKLFELGELAPRREIALVWRKNCPRVNLFQKLVPLLVPELLDNQA